MDESSDEKTLKQALSHLSTGLLDEEACGDEYGGAHVRWSAGEDDAGVTRQMLLSESLAKCLTVVWASGSVQGYDTGNVARSTVVSGWLVGRSLDVSVFDSISIAVQKVDLKMMLGLLDQIGRETDTVANDDECSEDN